MDADRLLAVLVDLAGEVGLDVRPIRGAAIEEGMPSRSALCRVYGSLWVVLAASDPPQERVAVLADALVAHAPRLLEERFLAPAVRACLEDARRRA